MSQGDSPTHLLPTNKITMLIKMRKPQFGAQITDVGKYIDWKQTALDLHLHSDTYWCLGEGNV